jgi:hypothetical protein
LINEYENLIPKELSTNIWREINNYKHEEYEDEKKKKL